MTVFHEESGNYVTIQTNPTSTLHVKPFSQPVRKIVAVATFLRQIGCFLLQVKGVSRVIG